MIKYLNRATYIYHQAILIAIFIIMAHFLIARELQMSSSVSGVRISFRDKYGEQAANVVIMVQAPDGKQYKAQRQVLRDNMGYVLLPEHFSGYSKGMPLNATGTYLWKCFF